MVAFIWPLAAGLLIAYVILWLIARVVKAIFGERAELSVFLDKLGRHNK